MIALIPARAGSKRIPGKNTKWLAGHPLICYTIAAAKQSGVFDRIVVCSDGLELSELAHQYGVEFAGRPPSGDDEPDVVWVRHVLLFPALAHADAFSILRPTSPFRTAATIQRAWAQFKDSDYSSIRAVEPVKQHPAKMWTVEGYGLRPFYSPLTTTGAPAHSSPTQTLPKVYVQNASLEMARRYVIGTSHGISGASVGPFFTQGYEGIDLNTPDDWQFAEMKIATGEWTLPPI